MIALSDMVWDEADETWRIPAPGEYVVIDLCSVSESGLRGKGDGATRMGGVVRVPDGTKLWDGAIEVSDKPNGKQLDAWESLFGYRPEGETLTQWLLDHLMNGSDPRGEAACKPLLPVRTLSLHLGQELFSRRFDFASDPYSAKVLEVLKLDNKELWEQENGSDAAKPVAGTTQRYLASLCEQYGIAKANYKDLLPADIRADVPAPLPHRTNFSENFNGADKSGVGYQLTLTDLTGGCANKNNKFANGSTAAGVIFRAEHDVSSQNHYVEGTGSIDGTGTVKTLELHCRQSSSADTYFYMFYRGNPGTENFRAGRQVTGSTTETVSTGSSVASPMRLRISVGEDGTASTFRGRVNGSQLYSNTDTNITGNTRGGARLRHNATLYGADIDDWIINDVFVSARLIGGNLINAPVLVGGVLVQ